MNTITNQWTWTWQRDSHGNVWIADIQSAEPDYYLTDFGQDNNPPRYYG